MSFRAICLSAIFAVLGGSVAARAFLDEGSGAGPTSSSSSSSGANQGAGGAHSLDGGAKSFSGLPDEFPSGDPSDLGSAGDGDADSPVADAMPYVTEGSFFALIGFALGYASRKVVKLLLILLAGFFLMVQGLSYVDVVQVDWSRAVDLANDLVLNLKENQTVLEVLKDRIPTAGAMVTGFALGYRKG